MSIYEDFSMQIFQSSTYEESFNAYNRYIQALAFQKMSYVFVPNSPFNCHQQVSPLFSVNDDFSQQFLEEYQTRNFQSRDYIIDAIKKGESNKLYQWRTDYQQNKVEPHQQIVLDTAKHDYDMGNGFSILTEKCANGIGATSIIGDQTDKLFALHIKEQAGVLRMATEVFHNHVVMRNYEVSTFILPSMFSQLNLTERQTLKSILEGFSVPKTAAKIGRSSGHIENVVRKIRLKIGGEKADGKPRITKDELLHFCGLMRIYKEL
jgi:hypothetical protein